MTDLEKEMNMLSSMNLQGTVEPVVQEQPVQQTVSQGSVQYTQAQTVQPQMQFTQPIQQTAPVQPIQQPVQVQSQPVTQAPVLDLNEAQQSIERNPYISVEIGTKVSNSIIDKFTCQKDEKKRVAILMPFFDVPGKERSIMAIKKHYDQDLGSFICWGGDCCKYESKPSLSYLIPVIEYPIANNNVNQPLPENFGPCKLKLFAATSEAYTIISDQFLAHEDAQGNAGSFDGYDFILTCVEPQFKKFTISVTSNTIRNNYKSFNECIEQWKAVRDKAYTAVAREISPEYYRTQKGIGYEGASVSTDVPSMDVIMQ